MSTEQLLGRSIFDLISRDLLSNIIDSSKEFCLFDLSAPFNRVEINMSHFKKGLWIEFSIVKMEEMNETAFCCFIKDISSWRSK